MEPSEQRAYWELTTYQNHDTNGVTTTPEDFWQMLEQYVGMEEVGGHPQGHNKADIQTTLLVDTVPKEVDFHFESYQGAGRGKLQLWCCFVDSNRTRILADARFSWCAEGIKAERMHSDICRAMAANR